MHFLYQPLTWGFLLVLVPLIIHLINLMRQRHVDWAAMEFLLKAHRKHRKWIWLRQMLLLAARMLIVAALVAMLAHLVTQKQWTLFFGNQTTHHFVLLDDSFSMSDKSGATSAFDRGTQALTQFAQRLLGSDVPQKLTLILWSRAAHAAERDDGSGDAAPVANSSEGTQAVNLDLNALVIDEEGQEVFAECVRKLVVSSSAVGPRAAIELAGQLVTQNPGESSVVHLISDFRQRDWQEAPETFEALKHLGDIASELQLVDCAESQHENLAVTQLRPLEGTLAAGVPVQLHIEVRNFGNTTARQVPVFISTTSAGSDLRAAAVELPALLIDEIPPGEAVSRQAQVFFGAAGEHVARVELPEDAIVLDNRRCCIVRLPATVPVLVVDGDPKHRNAIYFKTVFQPSDRVATGVSPDVRGVGFLSTATADSLAKYRAIYLFDVMRIDQAARSNLERYVRDGGGLGVFLGPNVDWQAYDVWYQGGKGLFPVALTAPRILNAAEESAGLVATPHPTLRVLAGDDNPFAASIRFSQYFGIPVAEMAADVEIVGRLGNGQPILIERRFGQGRVMVELSTLAPLWNNWATQPSFVVFLLELQSYLDSLRSPIASETVGDPIRFAFDRRLYSRELRLQVPGESDCVTITLQETDASEASESSGESSTGDEASSASVEEIGDGDVVPITVAGSSFSGQRSSDVPGVYEVLAKRLDGTPVTQRYALNVEPFEGDLELYERRSIRGSAWP